MSGTRIFCNQIIPVTDWNHDYVTVPSVLESQSPLPTLACFDLLNPLDNSGHGYTVSPGGGQVRDWGLHYENGALPSKTDFSKSGQGAVSFITAFKLSDLSRYTHIISNRVKGGGFNLYFNNGLYMSVIYPSGNTVIVYEGSVLMPEVDKWYVAAGIFDPANNNVRVQFSDLGVRLGSIGTTFPTNASLLAPLVIGGDTTGSTTSSMLGDIAFVALYDGAFTATQRDAMISVGRTVLQWRGLI
ncbi:LamG-like jellyroll fold domain-containing protein [Klebsiella michiganensis]|uniref:LamG-like jellyroll fold domain-containing protein n=1 Tax=Klebsiella michiganensis TaxID=1134687 RepID=UPI0030083C66